MTYRLSSCSYSASSRRRSVSVVIDSSDCVVGIILGWIDLDWGVEWNGIMEPTTFLVFFLYQF